MRRPSITIRHVGLKQFLSLSSWRRTVAMLVNIVLYASPLSTLGVVVRTRNSASIYVPWTIAALCCSGMWTIYGFAVGQVGHDDVCAPSRPSHTSQGSASLVFSSLAAPSGCPERLRRGPQRLAARPSGHVSHQTVSDSARLASLHVRPLLTQALPSDPAELAMRTRCRAWRTMGRCPRSRPRSTWCWWASRWRHRRGWAGTHLAPRHPPRPHAQAPPPPRKTRQCTSVPPVLNDDVPSGDIP
jgi:hypothetical protein